MADLLIERTQNTSWVVAYKALITIHHLMCYGNEVNYTIFYIIFFLMKIHSKFIIKL